MSTTGNDANDGLSSTVPKLTFATALTAAAIKGDTILLENGTYHVGTEFANGQKFSWNHEITIKAQNTRMVTISGGYANGVQVGQSTYGWWYKFNDDVATAGAFGPEYPMTVNVDGIKFVDFDCTSTTTSPLFATVGEDEWSFNNCDFDIIKTRTVVSMFGFGGFIGPGWHGHSRYTIQVDKYNCRGIFKNCTFKELHIGMTSNYAIGFFNCFGSYLRFANCTIEMNPRFAYGASYPSKGEGASPLGGPTLFYACNPGMTRNSGSNFIAVNSTESGNYTTYLGGTSSNWPVNDVKLINCILYNSSPHNHAFMASGYGVTGGDGVKRNGMSMAAGTRFNNTTSTLVDLGADPDDHIGTNAAHAANEHGDLPWYNSEFINCLFYKFENGRHVAGWGDPRHDGNFETAGYCITTYTDCQGSITYNNGSDVDPLFISTTVGDEDFALRPGSTAISLGTSVPDTFYDLDKPSTLGSIL